MPRSRWISIRRPERWVVGTRSCRALESELRLARDRAGAAELLPGLEGEERLRRLVVERPGHLRAIEVAERPQAELEAANAVQVVLLAAREARRARSEPEPEKRHEPALGGHRHVALRAERSERRLDLLEPGADRRRRSGREERTREAREPGVALRAQRAEAGAGADRGPDPLRALDPRRPLQELAQRRLLGRPAGADDALDADQPPAADEGDLDGRGLRLRTRGRSDVARGHHGAGTRRRAGLEVDREQADEREEKERREGPHEGGLPSPSSRENPANKTLTTR